MKRMSMKKLVVLVLFILIGFGIYSNSLNNPFYYDDLHHIAGNLYIRSLNSIPLYFTEPRTFSTHPRSHLHYRPLVLTSYTLNYALFKKDIPGYHLTNLAFHVGSSFLVFLIMLALFPRGAPVSVTPVSSPPISSLWTSLRGSNFFPALIAGLLFLMTPFNSEVVNYLSTRSTVMASFFYLLAFWCWVKYREIVPPTPAPPHKGGGEEGGREEGGNRFLYYIAALVAFLLAMLTKEIAITLPVVLWLYDLYFSGSRANELTGPSTGLRADLRLFHRRGYLPYLPFVLIGVFFGFMIRLIYFKSILMSGGEDVGWARFVLEVKVLAKYFVQGLVPTGLSVEHLISGEMNLYFVLSALLLLGLGVLTFFLLRHRGPLYRMVSFFIMWFFVVLLPTTVVSLVAPYQENRGYLAMVALVGIMIIGIEKGAEVISQSIGKTGWGGNLMVYSLVGFLLIGYGVGVLERNSVWHDEYALWSDVLKKYPQSLDARLSLGNFYSRRQDLSRAEAFYKEILQIDPKYAKALTNLGIIHWGRGEIAEAETTFRKVLEENPNEVTPHFFLARIHMGRREFPESVPHLLRVLSISPDNLLAATMLIDAYTLMGKLDEAYARLTKALEEDPDNPGIRRALGLIYARRGQWEAAAGEYGKVLTYMSEDPKTIRDMGYVQFKLGRIISAEGYFKRAIELNPRDPVASQSLGIIYQREGRYEEALSLYQRILSTDPKVFQAYNNLGLIYFAMGDYERAIGAFKEALTQNPDYHMVRINLAQAYEKQGRTDLARQEYQEAIRAMARTKKDDPLIQEAQRRLAALK